MRERERERERERIGRKHINQCRKKEQVTRRKGCEEKEREREREYLKERCEFSVLSFKGLLGYGTICL